MEPSSTPTVTDLAWMSEEEAVLTIADCTHSCMAFAHPFAGQVGDEMRLPLLGFGTRDVELVRTQEPGFRQLGAAFDHEVVGVVIDARAALVRVGGILVELDTPLPGDIGDGESVGFVVARLDFAG